MLLTSPNNVPYSILVAETTGAYDPSGATAQLACLIDSGDLNLFLSDILGPGGVGLPHPVYTNLFSYGATWSHVPAGPHALEACDLSSLATAFSKCKVVIGYRSWEVVTERHRFSANMITAPESSFHFSDGTTVPHGAGVLVPEIEVNVARRRQTTEDMPTIMSCLGKVNDSIYRGYATGCLLFGGVSDEWAPNIWGGHFGDLEYAFVFRSRPWNQFLKPAGGWDYVTDGAGNPPYLSADFSVLAL